MLPSAEGPARALATGWARSGQRGLIIALLSTAAAVARAQFPAPLQVIPLAGSLPAPAGAVWRTELMVANLAVRPASIGVRVMSAGGSVAVPAAAITRPAAPGAAIRFDDAIAPALRGARGWLLVTDATSPDCSSQTQPFPAPLVASARLVRADRPSAPGIEVPAGLLAINFGDLPSRFFPVHPDGRRIWVVVTNISTVELSVDIALVSADGTTLGSARRSVSSLAIGTWRLAELRLWAKREPPVRIEVRRAGVDGWNPCRVAAQPPPCLSLCPSRACPGRLRLPAFPAFAVVIVEADGASGAVQVLGPSVDQVGSSSAANRFTQRHCPDAGGAGRISDLMTWLLMRRDLPDPP